MKNIKLLISLLLLSVTILLTESCSKAEPCINTNCLNGGTCVNGACECPDGYIGNNCEEQDPCFGITCQNGGNCVDSICECPDGFIGTNCELLDTTQIQLLLDIGVIPQALYEEGVSLEQIYGKIYQGGFIFYLNTDDGSGLVAATEDQSEEAPWGCYGIEISGADGTNIGTGSQNTIDIVSGCSEAGIAAKLCAELILNGKDDWFLPAKEELNLMWENLADSDGNNESTGPDDPGNIGGFTERWYYHSTELYSGTAGGRDFGNGLNLEASKAALGHVRAARAF